MMNIRDIKGIGEKTEKLFNKLGIYTDYDLIEYYPRNYDCFMPPVSIEEVDSTNGTPAIEGTVASNPVVKRIRSLNILSVLIKDNKGEKIKLTWFNMPFLKNSLKMGYKYIFRGQVKKDKYGNNPTMEQPVIYSLGDYEKKMGVMQPVYPLTKGLTNNMVTKTVSCILDNLDLQEDYLPDIIKEKAGLMEYNEAVKAVHFPVDKETIIKARKRLIFDEFFVFLLALRSFKENTKIEDNRFVIDNNAESDHLIESLPYKLTEAQLKVLGEIRKDMLSNRVMNRLVQGDVGCGKTIIAFLSLIDIVAKGYQGALMVPTEVLATQHYENLLELKEKYSLNINPVLLTGSVTAANKRKIYASIEAGEANIIIGTHALIQEKVIYDKLALVITDEQHRFGVKQREKLSGKGDTPHILVMSATPIPRTLAIILYGDLDISVIDAMPSNRLPIKNCVVDRNYRPNAYKFIENQVRNGHQAYIICPMVESMEEGENNSDLCDVISYSKMLSEELPSDIKVEYLHGKMKPSEKNNIMERFARNEINVLVSTTVIEVGVNVPNATVMMIEDAERFGLAGLHQLRGRVGRGEAQSYCIFVSGAKSKDTRERLEILNKSNDGFYIANKDLALRGPGDFFGIRQSGDMSFKLGDIYADATTLKLTADILKDIEDGNLTLSLLESERIDNKLQNYMKIHYSINL
ncbi:MAG: ATP-dependent DNA helicase RecG [Lachnospiraceae bacterium]|nr:ATP-dependent DNA helicase RecG [Lachnospiraceae bacterium]